MFLTEVRLRRLSILPERDMQYHRVKYLTVALVGAGHPLYRHSVADIPLLYIKLREVCQPQGR